MSPTIKRNGTDFEVLSGLETFPEVEPLELFTAEELSALQRQRNKWLQLPSFLRADEDEDEDASVLFNL